MSLQNLNKPPLVALAGATISIGMPILDGILSSSSVSLTLLKTLNVAAFATNCISVSIPGRLDGPQDEAMREGSLNPNKPNANSPLLPYRTLVNPAGWAFAIWAPIYLGEAAFVLTQAFSSDATTAVLLPQITAPFIAANLFQSLWCASFRPTFGNGWHKWISAAMLAGTATSLGLVHSAGAAVVASSDATLLTQLLLPLTIHFGWTSAATLVNLNGSLASDRSVSVTKLIALGNSSALLATGLGVGLTVSQASPAYGLTLAWALAACANGLTKRVPSKTSEEVKLKKAAAVQKVLCQTGSFLCAAAALYTGFM